MSDPDSTQPAAEATGEPLLLLVPRGDELAVYDERTGQVVDRIPRGERRDGTCYQIEGRWVALYARAGGLFFQLGRDRFRLDAPATRLTYWHDWSASVTHFRIASDAADLTLRYQSWWSRLGLDPATLEFEPERDADEDPLAHVYELWKDPAQQERVAARWG
jgi:hypothetical protein